MADINQKIARAAADMGTAATPAYGAHESVRSVDPALLEIVELLFFAYRDFTCEPDVILDKFGFGRAHHRVLHFVYRHPGLRVADLLDILKITKQSLGRVLKQLVDEGYIAQEEGQIDRRERLLYPTPRGKELADRLAGPQLDRIALALEKAGNGAEETVREFLQGMISEQDRQAVAELISTVDTNANE
ncbi:MAG: MarR family transcriptional regulator [Hyphomicrobiales bacterium]|nr:MarR family transcriptional regulator [Hyphomicrobiales bacterium]